MLQAMLQFAIQIASVQQSPIVDLMLGGSVNGYISTMVVLLGLAIILVSCAGWIAH